MNTSPRKVHRFAIVRCSIRTSLINVRSKRYETFETYVNFFQLYIIIYSNQKHSHSCVAGTIRETRTRVVRSTSEVRIPRRNFETRRNRPDYRNSEKPFATIVLEFSKYVNYGREYSRTSRKFIVKELEFSRNNCYIGANEITNERSITKSKRKRN